MNMIMSRAQQHQYRQIPPPQAATWSPGFIDRIPIKELEVFTKTLGSGSFGTVFKSRWRGLNVAVKEFKTREEISSFLIEVKQLSCVKHPNIVTLYGASTLTSAAYLIMEYAEGGSLSHLLHECKQQEYDLRHACSWAMQTARGVAYLHGIRPKPIMHRDLKPANLLLFSRGKIIKICDFGTACTVKTQMTNNMGSASYMAPEVFSTSSYLESGDVFSWSIIFWEILARRHPYSQQYSNPYQILWRVKQEGVRPSELESCPKIIWNLINRSWHKDPKLRPNMRQVTENMEFIYSLTEKSTHDDSSSRQESPHHQAFPLCSHFIERHQHQHAFPPIEVRKQVSFNAQSPSTSNKREPYKQSLAHRLEVLQRRSEELEELVRRGKRDTADDSFEEFERFANRKTDLKKKETDIRRKSSENRGQNSPFDDQCIGC